MLFTRYPNSKSRDFLHDMVDAGADCIVTVHSHCLGCHEEYKGVHIFHSIGDFLMDGASFRRRRACVLNLSINNNHLDDWSITPTYTNFEHSVALPDAKQSFQMLHEYEITSEKLSAHIKNYESFYKRAYKKEILLHSLSTIHFEYKRRGLCGLFRILGVRVFDVLGMVRRVITDRSKMSYDSDAINEKHTMSNNDIQ